MNAIISLITSFFTFDKLKGLFDIGIRSLTFSKMLVINLLLLAAMSAYLFSLFNGLKFIYEKINYLISLLNNLDLNNSEISLVFLGVIKSIGLYNAFVDSFNLFFPAFLSLLGAYATKLAIKALRSVRSSLISLFISKI